jgi:hypothetical protein
MNESEPGSQDQQWLDALAGRPDATADERLNRQALAVRRALIAQKASIQRQTPAADQMLYQQILFRLRREKGRHSALGVNKFRHWAMAASLVLGFGLAVIIGPSVFETVNEVDATRGGEGVALQIAENPEARSAELVAGLKAAGADPIIVSQRESRRIRIEVMRSEAVVDFLADQRIITPPSAKVIVIVVEPPPGRN